MSYYTDRAIASWSDDEVRNAHEDMMRLTLEIVAKALFNVDQWAAEDDVGRVLESIMAATRRRTSRLVNVPDWVPTPGNRALHRAERTLDSVVDDIIVQRRGAGNAGNVIAVYMMPGFYLTLAPFDPELALQKFELW